MCQNRGAGSGAVPVEASPFLYLDILGQTGPMGSIAHSHIMAGDTRSCLELQGVFLVEVNSTLPEIPCHNTRGVRTNMNKIT